MEITTLAVAFLAGLVSIFSPCVLPLIPIVLSTAVSQHRFGPVALVTGLAFSFVTLGLFLAIFGFTLGLDEVAFRYGAAGLLMMMGLIMLIPPLQVRLAVAAGLAANWANERLETTGSGLTGQFGVGMLMGVVWTPCVGPTLGAISILAARGENLGHVTLTMLLFGVGTAVPLVLLGMASREAVQRWRGRIALTGRAGKLILGFVLVFNSIMIFMGWDRQIQSYLLDLMPEWLTFLTAF